MHTDGDSIGMYMWCVKCQIILRRCSCLERYNVNGELEASFGLCENRHAYPVGECIFPENIAVFAFARQELDAKEIIEPLVRKGVKRVVIYASGCVPALISAINVCQKFKVREIVIMHYDAVKNDYQPQNVVTNNDIMW